MFRNAATNRCYRNRTFDQTWAVGRADCQAWGGDLAGLTSDAERAFVGTAITDDTWTSATDIANEGTWLWATGEPWAYTNWSPGQPDNWQGLEDCMELLLSTKEFNDEDCTHIRNYMCERGPTAAECPSWWGAPACI